jgi:hypothetical protein
VAEEGTLENNDRYDAASIKALRAFSERLGRGGRFRATMLPTEEGLAFGVKIA